MSDLYLLRALFIAIVGAVAFFFRPFQLEPATAAAAAAATALLFVFAELRLRTLPVKRVTGAAVGAACGIVLAFFASLVLSHTSGAQPETVSFLQLSMLAVGAYLGLTLGAEKGFTMMTFNSAASGSLPAGSTDDTAAAGNRAKPTKLHILDTSVIIDGRIADIAETGFIDCGLAIPQFVLRELQLVADSADSLKRNRGRRGLDVLQRLQKAQQIRVEILDDDFPHIREVDMKLVELGKLHKCKVVTNDFNLNKVAQLHGVEVLNINELANALKPVVLPGEIMRVFVLKEGKEYNQGVAYLDDGTMVVVDNARRLISKTIDISVTSVLQTTAGKMIFGKFDDRLHAVYEKPQGDNHSSRHRDSSASPNTPATSTVAAPQP